MDVRYRYVSEGLGRVRREVDVRHQYGTGSRTRRYFILPDPRLGPTIDAGSDFVFGKHPTTGLRSKKMTLPYATSLPESERSRFDRLRIEIGPIDTTLRTDRMRSNLDRKCGSIWIEREKDTPESWHICGMGHSVLGNFAGDTQYGWRSRIRRINYSRWYIYPSLSG